MIEELIPDFLNLEEPKNSFKGIVKLYTYIFFTDNSIVPVYLGTLLQSLNQGKKD